MDDTDCYPQLDRHVWEPPDGRIYATTADIRELREIIAVVKTELVALNMRVDRIGHLWKQGV